MGSLLETLGAVKGKYRVFLKSVFGFGTNRGFKVE